VSTDVEVRLSTAAGQRRVGRLLDAERRIHFEYDAAFLGSGLELSPFKLPLRPGVFDEGPQEFHGLYGLFHDSLPDGWGLLLMHRRMREAGIDPARISVLTWLRCLGERGMGALTFHPVEGGPANKPLELSLKKLEGESRKVFEGRVRTVLPELELAGGSPGGARPKVVVGLGPGDAMVAGANFVPDGFEHWLIKFAAGDDPTDAGPLEETYARMARRAGIDMPQTRLFPLDKKRRAFGVRRFDRVGNRRVHVHTLGGLLHASHRLPSLDYQAVLAATYALTRDRQQALEAFRRAAFNVLACNRDDHAHNFAYLMDERGSWTMSPAFDLTPSSGPGGYHTTSILGEALKPTRAQLLALAKSAALTPSVAEAALRKVERAVDGFAATPKFVSGVGKGRAPMAFARSWIASAGAGNQSNMKTRLLCFPVVLLVAACGGGKPIESKQELADSLANASIPTAASRGAALSLSGQAAFPEPSFTLRGAEGGEATLSLNPAGVLLGLAAKGVLFDVKYDGFCEDGVHRLDGTLSVLAQFDYVAACGEPAYVDLKLSLVGKLSVNGPVQDELDVNVTLVTRFTDLSLRQSSIDLHLNGTVHTREASFSFDQENLAVLWAHRHP
jgi:serine/threonine-protein kinase HipA